MDVFTAAADAAFADPNFGIDAQWRQGGTGAPVGCRVVWSRPSDVLSLGRGARVIAGGHVLDVRRSEISAPAKNDTFDVPIEALTDSGDPILDDVSAQISGIVRLTVMAEPQPDDLGIVWTCEAKAGPAN